MAKKGTGRPPSSSMMWSFKKGIFHLTVLVAAGEIDLAFKAGCGLVGDEVHWHVMRLVGITIGAVGGIDNGICIGLWWDLGRCRVGPFSLLDD